MKEVRVAIVGMGIGKPNARAIAKNPRGRVVALCDLLEDRMHEFARELPEPVKFYTNYKQMCRDPEIDAVFVGTPNQWHVPVALEAVRRDKHVLVTKPLADSAAAARKLVRAAEAAGVVNMMSLSQRNGNNVLYMRSLAEKGEFGDLYYARARSIRRSGIPDWSLGFVQAGGGAFRDMGVHLLDAAWWIMGMPMPLTVTGVAGARFGPQGVGYTRFRRPPKSYYSEFAADDYGGGFIRFANGAGLQIESFWASHQPNEMQIELFGDKAGAQVNPPIIYRTVNDAPQDISVNVPGEDDRWGRIAGHFIDCILDSKTCTAPLRHGWLVQEMLEALLKSADTGKEVRLRLSDTEGNS